MKLYLAIAALVLVLIASAEATDETLQEKIAKVGKQINDFGEQVAQKTSAAFEDLNSSQFAVETRRWWAELVETTRERFGVQR